MFYIDRIIVCVAILVLSTLFVHSHAAAESDRSVFEILDPINNEEPDFKEESEDTSHAEQENGALEDEVDFNSDMEGIVASNEESSTFKLIFNLIFYTLIMVVLIIVLFKLLAYKQRKMGEHQLIQTIGGTSLGNNKSLQLVKVGGTIYLLGVADQISLIKEIDDQELIARMEMGQSGSMDYISKGIEGLKTRFISAPKSFSEVSFQEMFEESIHKQKEKMREVEITMEEPRDSPSERRNRTWNL